MVVAPTAFIRPISFVRSFTVSVMTFMMPMPPTTREIAPMPASVYLIIANTWVMRSANIFCVNTENPSFRCRRFSESSTLFATESADSADSARTPMYENVSWSESALSPAFVM